MTSTLDSFWSPSLSPVIESHRLRNDGGGDSSFQGALLVSGQPLPPRLPFISTGADATVVAVALRWSFMDENRRRGSAGGDVGRVSNDGRKGRAAIGHGAPVRYSRRAVHTRTAVDVVFGRPRPVGPPLPLRLCATHGSTRARAYHSLLPCT